MQESTAYDAIREEGETRGEIKGGHRWLLRLGKKRFGPPTPEIESALTAIKSLDRLERMADAVLTAKSWEELLATP